MTTVGPDYRCWIDEEDDEENANGVSAFTASDAAELFAERQCQSEPESYDTFEDGATVSVRSVATGELLKFHVHIEREPTFHAEPA